MYTMYKSTSTYPLASPHPAPSTPTSSSSSSLRQEWDELHVAQERLKLQQQRLELEQDKFKAEKLNWKRSHKIKSAIQYDDQSINSTSSPVPNDQNDMVLIQDLRKQLSDVQQESKLWKEKWNTAQKLQETMQAELKKIKKLQKDELEKWKLKCAQAQNELEQQKNEWQQQEQASEMSFQCKLDDFRERIRVLEGDKKKLQLELEKKQKEHEKEKETQQQQQEQSCGSTATEEADRWRREAERLQAKLDETTKQFENLQLLVPRNKQLLEQAMVQQEKFRTKCNLIEMKYENQQELVKELETFKQTLTRKHEELERQHQQLVKDTESGNHHGFGATTFVKTTLPSEGPREWIREGRKHVVEWEWTSIKGLFGMYTGWLDVSGNPHGHGTLRIEDGSIYDGEWIRGLREGHGAYTGIDGEFYRGSWHKDQHHGRGVYVWPDGHMFVGDYHVGARQGFGIETWPNGARYEGEFQNDFMHGKGAYWYPDGRRVTGEFKEGRCEDDPGNGEVGAFINS